MIDDEFEEDDEKTLDQALDEMDRWGQRAVKAIEGLSDKEVTEYFKGARARLEETIGRPLTLPKDPAWLPMAVPIADAGPRLAGESAATNIQRHDFHLVLASHAEPTPEL